MPDGSVILVEIDRGTVTKVAAGAVSVVADLGGGPNGLALGPDGALYVCNSGGFIHHTENGLTRVLLGTPEAYTGGRIERLDLATGESRILYDRCGEHGLRGPNDIVFDAGGGFYFTDLGKSRPRDRHYGGVYYAKADGSHSVGHCHRNAQRRAVDRPRPRRAVRIRQTIRARDEVLRGDHRA